MKKTANKIILLALLLLVAAGCDKDGMHIASKSKLIRPKVSGVSLTKTATGEPARKQVGAIPISEDPDNPLYVLVFEQDMAERDAMVQATKGTVVTSDNIEEFYMNAYAEGEWHDNETNVGYMPGPYFGGVKVTKTGPTDHPWVMEEDKYWLNDVSLSFWSYNDPWVTLSIKKADGYNKSKIDLYTIDNDGKKETDLVLAYNHEYRKFNESGEIEAGTATGNRSDEYVDIRFYHALSAIRFDVSGVDAGIPVSKIQFNNIYVQGTCSINIDSTSGKPLFSWATVGTPGSVQMAVSSTDFESDGSFKAGTDKEFMIIPQELTSSATISVTFSDGTITKNLNPASGTTTWLPGKYYTYKLSRTPYSWDYSFTIDGGESYTYNFDNNFDNNPLITLENISSTRTRTDDSSISEDVAWTIQSYKIGSSEAVAVNAESFSSNPCWFSASHPSSNTRYNEIRLIGRTCEYSLRNTHGYWVGSNGEWSPADWSGQGVIDLSKMDYREDDPTKSINAHDMTTANCYVIRHAGTYKFPLVYGNAMKKGGYNTKAYAPGITTSNCWATFKNHLDADITSPFIEQNSDCTVVGDPVILWQTDGPVVTDVTLSAGPPTTPVTAGNVRYVQFEVPQSSIQQNNALIAVKDASGTIIWSWHIWITNDPDVKRPVEVTNYDDIQYHFFGMDNIGKITDKVYDPREDVLVTLKQTGSGKTVTLTVHQIIPKPLKSFMFFQWGRKDPFPDSKKDWQDTEVITKVPVTVEENVKSIGYAIQHPTEFRGEYGNYYWAKSLPYNAWAGSVSGIDLVENGITTTKTIYDPSPVFYMVPAQGAYSGFADERLKRYYDFDPGKGKTHMNAPSTEYNQGYSFYTSLREIETGPGTVVKAKNIGGPEIWFSRNGLWAGNAISESTEYLKRGWYFTSALKTDGHSPLMMFAFDDVVFNNIGSASLSNGHSVRPILEADFDGTGSLDGGINPDDWTQGGGNIGL